MRKLILFGLILSSVYLSLMLYFGLIAGDDAPMGILWVNSINIFLGISGSNFSERYSRTGVLFGIMEWFLIGMFACWVSRKIFKKSDVYDPVSGDLAQLQDRSQILSTIVLYFFLFTVLSFGTVLVSGLAYTAVGNFWYGLYKLIGIKSVKCCFIVLHVLSVFVIPPIAVILLFLHLVGGKGVRDKNGIYPIAYIRSMISKKKVVFWILTIVVVFYSLFKTIPFLHVIVSIHRMRTIMTEKEPDARVFVGNIINSIINETDFYKKYSWEKGLEGINENKKDVSKDFKVVFMDISIPYYEYILDFGNGKELELWVRYNKGDGSFCVERFEGSRYVEKPETIPINPALENTQKK